MNFFHKKVVLITGATSGIGYALAQAASKKGAHIVICGRNQQKLDEIASQHRHESWLCIQADVSNEADCKHFIDEAYKNFGRIDILINNAGISMRASFLDVDLHVLKKNMDINYWGTVYCTKYALPHILQQKGTVVGISSIAGYKGLPCRTGYSSSKFAMQGFLESLRIEMLHSGVNVMWVSPGFVSTNIRNTALSASGTPQAETPLDESKLMSAEECATRILKAIEQRKRNVLMSLQGKLTVWLNKFFPSFVDAQVYKHFANEENSPLKKHTT